jgi:hypothetical protein
MASIAGDGMLRPADDLLAPAVATTIGKLQLEDADAAVVKLAKRYAAAIDAAADQAGALERLGPKLLTALNALGASPRARSILRARSGGGGNVGPNRLQALREARR